MDAVKQKEAAHGRASASTSTSRGGPRSMASLHSSQTTAAFRSAAPPPDIVLPGVLPVPSQASDDKASSVSTHTQVMIAGRRDSNCRAKHSTLAKSTPTKLPA